MDMLLGNMLNVANGVILMDPLVSRLPPEQRMLALRDFSACRQHLALTFQQKLSHWRQLPHVLHGIAHHDAAVARRCANRALTLYDGARGDDGDHHCLSKKLCSTGSATRGQLEAFAAGQRDLAALPELEVWAAKVKFVMITERWIEGRHAPTKHHIAKEPHAGCVHIAWRIALPSIRSATTSTTAPMPMFRGT